ncbi:MAG: oligosaccharide flippase family protein, partial [Gammaproteobacteria bacterium]
TIAVLEAGMGIWGLVWVTLGTALTGVLVMSLLAWRKGVWPRWNPRLISRDTLREITGFSAWAFLNQASIRIFLYTDTVIIGLISGSRMVTYYTIAFMLVDYGYTLAAQVTNTFIPSLGRLAGAGDHEALRETMLRGIRLAALLGIPITFGIFFFAQPFIGLWMGEAYAWAGALTAILISAKVMGIINGPMGAAIWSVGNIKPLAIANIVGALLNAVASASVLLYTDYGVHGVAVVSAITIFILNMVVVPLHGARLLEWPLWDYLAEIARRWIPPSLLFALCALGARELFAIDNWWSFFAITLGITAAYGLIAYPLFLRPALKSGRW